MSNNFIWMKTVWNVDLIWCHLLVLDSFFVSIHFIIAKLSAVDRPSPEVRSYIDSPPAAVFTLHLCFLTDSTKSAALSRLNEIIYDFNVLQSCPTDRRLSVETLRSLHWETLIHMFRSWDDKSLISLLPNQKKDLLMIWNRPCLAADLQPFATSVSPRTICTVSLWKWEVDWLSTTFHISLFLFACTLFSCSLINTKCATGQMHGNIWLHEQ